MHQRNQLQCTAQLSKMDKRGVVMSLTPLMSIFLMNRLNHISHSHKTFRARVWYLNSKPSNQNAILIERSNWIFVEYENKTRTLKFYDVRPVPIRLIQWVKQVTHSIQDNETVITSGEVKTRQLKCSKQVAHSKIKREKQITNSIQDNQSSKMVISE